MKGSETDFRLRGPDDFVRLDGLCAQLLGDFFQWLQAPEGGGVEAQRASDLAHAADRYLRNFVVDIVETGPADSDPSLPRRYLGNWYILNTLEPSHEEVDRILVALRKLYAYLALRGVLPDAAAEAAAREADDGAHFHRRLDDFWALTPEGIGPWRRVDDYRRGEEPSPAP
ncbi:MAG: hypothetical protein HGA98_02900 [Deltaproteobacteria bacterium]|nr:hypothetical protein [Deltaproteobacteria bacterium]